jgi:hypothetical protein
MEFALSLADLERLDLLLNDINGSNYIHERVQWLREQRPDHEDADRLQEAFEELRTYVGVLLTRAETIAELERVAQSGYR